MSTVTDLAGFLRNDEDSLTIKFLSWFGDRPKPPLKIRIRWRAERTTSEESVGEDIDLPGVPKSAENLIDEIERRIVNRLGYAPTGYLRVMGWAKGKAGDRGVDRSCTLSGIQFGDGPDANLSIVLAILNRSESHNREMFQQMREVHTANMKLCSDLGESLQRAAVTRTATTAAADSGSAMSLVALGVLVVASPAVKRAFGLPENAPLSDVLVVLQGSMKRAMGTEATPPVPGLGLREGPPRPPVSTVPPTTAAPPAAIDGPAPEEGAPAAGDVSAVAEAIRMDPSILDRLVAELVPPEQLDQARVLLSHLDITPNEPNKPNSEEPPNAG